MMKRKRDTNIYTGPSCAYIATESHSPTGRTWKEIQERNDQNRIEILTRAGLPLSFENLHNLGDKYLVDKFGRETLIKVYDPILESMIKKKKPKK